jgi:hypothetical protein
MPIELGLIIVFATRHRLKCRVDGDGTQVIPGKFGQVYECGNGQLAVMVMPRPPRKNYWAIKRNKLAALGCTVLQDGECEGTAAFDPDNPAQSKAAIRAAGITRKRRISPDQLNRQITWLLAAAGRAL